MISLLLMALLGLTGCGNTNLDFPTEYQAVYLDNGQIFFGKLSDAGSSFPMLRDVFFVQTQTDREKKESKHLLFKRGAMEGHLPDFMRLNAQHIVVIEPVAPDSRVAQLIREAKAPRPPETKEAPTPPAANSTVPLNPRPPNSRAPGNRPLNVDLEEEAQPNLFGGADTCHYLVRSRSSHVTSRQSMFDNEPETARYLKEIFLNDNLKSS